MMKFVDYIEVYYYVTAKDKIFEGSTSVEGFEFENNAEGLAYIKSQIEELCAKEDSDFQHWLIDERIYEDFINYEIYLNAEDILEELERAEDLDEDLSLINALTHQLDVKDQQIAKLTQMINDVNYKRDELAIYISKILENQD